MRRREGRVLKNSWPNMRRAKNSDLTLEKEKSIIEEMSASSIDQFAFNIKYASNDIA